MYVRVSSDPADIGDAGKLVIGVYIEDILNGQSCAEYVTGCRMYDTLGLASGAGRLRGVEKLVDMDRRTNISHKG
jgi:hypothetical protein